jgi:pimeloyl-ACP methyl ester carboxylesterase
MEETTLNVNGFKSQALINKAEGTPIIFIHGLSYSNEVWQRLHVTELLVEKKVPFLAIDMPFGIKNQCEPKSRDPTTNLNFIVDAIKTVFGEIAPVIVGASLGGHVALNYASKHPVKGLFLIAPAHAFQSTELMFAYTNFHFPVRIVWGAYDTVISGEDMRTLVDKMPNAKLLVYNGAAHSAYQDQPEWFKTDLLKLYASVTT